ncbi:MAG: hypothetical protein IPK83_24350 [Planctomycetes bacterium]|nr:hypothetical protein [Planctomycetota bacterium]
MQRRTALTLIEVLVVLAASAALAAALAMSHREAFSNKTRHECASNLRGIGQAQYIYAQDDPQTFTAYGGVRKENDGAMRLFDPKSRKDVPDINGLPSPTVDLWMLIRVNNTTPRQFVCPATKDVEDKVTDATKYWDFGKRENLSYAYLYQHDPDLENVSTSSHPLIPIMADGNPYLRGKIDAKPLDDRNSDARGNSTNHGRNKRPGQNVLYQDSHVNFETSPSVGLSGRFSPELKKSNGRDNIYTMNAAGADALVDPGDASPTPKLCNPASSSDAVLVP